MSLFTRTPTDRGDVDAAESAVVDLEATAEKWRVEAETAAAGIVDLAARVGDLALDDETAAVQASEEVARLTGRVAVAKAAAAAAQGRLTAARRVVLTERARVLRARAERLAKVIPVRERRTAELLAALAAHEECPYTPERPGELPVGTRAEFACPMTTVLAEHVTWLRNQADGLEQQAGALNGEALVAAVAKPLPEPSDLDRSTADDGTVTSGDYRFNRRYRAAL